MLQLLLVVWILFLVILIDNIKLKQLRHFLNLNNGYYSFFREKRDIVRHREVFHIWHAYCCVGRDYSFRPGVRQRVQRPGFMCMYGSHNKQSAAVSNS